MDMNYLWIKPSNPPGDVGTPNPVGENLSAIHIGNEKTLENQVIDTRFDFRARSDIPF